jgi:hypothetical protein
VQFLQKPVAGFACARPVKGAFVSHLWVTPSIMRPCRVRIDAAPIDSDRVLPSQDADDPAVEFFASLDC